MAVKWTTDQQRVIDSRNCNLLVSAAAGSGKTAVLVERIIHMITDEASPMDINRLLVVTFTNAAAAEMRERVGAAIEERLEAEPDNTHLQQQAVLVHHANITTMHSFCMKLVRDHFDRLMIDPTFRTGDEGEIQLMKADVIKELLEDHYEAGGEEFETFVETFAHGKGDGGLDEFILKTYDFSMSNPWPRAWINQCREELSLSSLEEMENTPWMTYLMEDVKLQLGELADQCCQAMEICLEEEGPLAYLPMIQNDLERMKGLKECEDYKSLNEKLKALEFDKLTAIRSKDVDPERKNLVTDLRNRVKKAAGKMQDLYCFEDIETIVTQIGGSGGPIQTLLTLTEEFSDRYQQRKQENNMVDFDDLEHYVLKILVTEEEGKLVPTKTADLLSLQFEEILVDEYQDSNFVQETIITSLSRERKGKPNVFMVGDVKQSIYRFRLARPELFMEKYESYENGFGPYQKIELHQNFRSRASVLESINRVFYRIMSKNLGNIPYTKEAALHPGAQFQETERTAGTPTELLLVNVGSGALKQLDEDNADYTGREIEARLIADRIRELTDPHTGLWVWDKEEKQYRLARNGDIVILLRSISGWAEPFVNVLMNEGITAYAESKTGYFDTMEVETVLSILGVIDNPIHDIPLAAALKSPVGGLDDGDLSCMVAAYKRQVEVRGDQNLYGAYRHFLNLGIRESTGETGGRGVDGRGADGQGAGGRGADGQETDGRGADSQGAGGRGADGRGADGRGGGSQGADIQGAGIGGSGSLGERETKILQKLRRFQALMEEFTFKARYLGIHELLYEIYQKTGYYDYVSAMASGETRQANLDMLVEKAVAFESTSYHGLFHFIRYIEKLKKYNTDFGEAVLAGDSENTVRIMSIHKSKGLEFPVVFLAGMAKNFNKQDAYSKILIDPDLGIGSDFLDLEQRVKAPTLKKNVLKRRSELESLGEELRVLYVGMTRAKEKLIMTAADRSLEKRLEKWNGLGDRGFLPFTALSSAGCYLDWVLMSLPGAEDVISMRLVSLEELVGQEAERQVISASFRDEVLNLDTNQVYDREYARFLKENLSYEYPYLADVDLHAKMSVSELKRLGQEEDLEESEFLPTIPHFMEESQEVSAQRGVHRGTAYHRALELLPFSGVTGVGDVENLLEKLVKEGLLHSESRQLLDPFVIWTFMDSPMGRRMAKAEAEGGLFKEQQFVMGLPAKSMGKGESSELVLIQGIIDCYFVEDGKVVLADYKTDFIRPGQEQVLADRYQTQLDYYEKAVEQILSMEVKEKLIYSLTLQKEILLAGNKDMQEVSHH